MVTKRIDFFDQTIVCKNKDHLWKPKILCGCGWWSIAYVGRALTFLISPLFFFLKRVRMSIKLLLTSWIIVRIKNQFCNPSLRPLHYFSISMIISSKRLSNCRVLISIFQSNDLMSDAYFDLIKNVTKNKHQSRHDFFISII